MLRSEHKILVIGYGNPGRQDDGLGPALAAALEERKPSDVTVDADYQLTVEDAAAVAAHDVVIFADAAVSGPEPFEFREVSPGDEMSFSSHSLSPAGVLALARRCFDARTAGYALAIRGYAFDDFGEGLSPAAQANLLAAVEFLQRILRERSFSEAAPHFTSDAACATDGAARVAIAKGDSE